MAAKIYDVARVAKFIKSSGAFHRVLDKVKFIKAESGTIVAELKVEEEHTNYAKTLHGGLSATMVDGLTTGALYMHENSDGYPGVSINLNLTYLKAAKLGDEIVIDCRTLKAGKTMAHMSCEITNKATGELLVKGLHTLYIMRPKS